MSDGSAHAFDATDLERLTELQGEIVDPRYAATGWRSTQTFVGATVAGYREDVHYVCPRPEDAPRLMRGWNDLVERTVLGSVHPVIAAAVASFAFVLVHPFDDGNGRLHRFLIHACLARRSFGPDDVVLPVSAAILRERRRYDEVLESVSAPIHERVPWRWTETNEIEVDAAGTGGPTRNLYRTFDATEMVTFLFACIADAVEQDLVEELGFLAVFDRAVARARDVVDMPDRRLTLFVRLVLQNGGTLSARKRWRFEELTDDEVAAMEVAVRSARDSVALERDDAYVNDSIRGDP